MNTCSTAVIFSFPFIRNLLSVPFSQLFFDDASMTPPSVFSSCFRFVSWDSALSSTLMWSSSIVSSVQEDGEPETAEHLSPSKCDQMCPFSFPASSQPPRWERSSDTTMDGELLDAGSLWPHVGAPHWELVGGEQIGEHGENTKIQNHGTPHATLDPHKGKKMFFTLLGPRWPVSMDASKFYCQTFAKKIL